MIEKISLALLNESGESLILQKMTVGKIESELETFTADVFSKIIFANNSITDDEIRLAEKFHFAAALKQFQDEQVPEKENV